MSRPTAISLFSGLGGIDIGLHQAGITTAVCVERDEYAAQTLRANSTEHACSPTATESLVEKKYPWRVIEGDIYDIPTEQILTEANLSADDVNLVVGGPPCQTFSRSNEGNRNGTDEARGMLFEAFARVLGDIQPDAFLFENVRGLASANDGEDLETIKRAFQRKGYTLNTEILNAADFGVPQTRERLFLIGLREDTSPDFPEQSHVEVRDGIENSQDTITQKEPWVSASEALQDFNLDECVEEQGGYTNAVGGQYGHLLKNIPQGANYQHFSERKYVPDEGAYQERDADELEEKMFDWRSRHWNYLLKQDENRPTWTIQASPGTYVGPFHWRSRRFSFLEQMRLMDLPITYFVAGPPREIQTQIGNAAPPGMVKAIAGCLLDQIGSAPQHFEQESSGIVSPDGGDNSGKTHIEVQNGTSPWIHADQGLIALGRRQSVHLESRGKKIANLLDVTELICRNSDGELQVEFEESIKKTPERKSDAISKLDAWIDCG